MERLTKLSDEHDAITESNHYQLEQKQTCNDALTRGPRPAPTTISTYMKGTGKSHHLQNIQWKKREGGRNT